MQAVEKLDPNLLDRDLIGIKMVTGGSVTVNRILNERNHSLLMEWLSKKHSPMLDSNNSQKDSKMPMFVFST